MTDALLAYITETAWALEKRVLDRAVEVFTRHFQNDRISDHQVSEIIEVRDAKRAASMAPSDYEVQDGTAIIPISGIIARHSHMINGVSQDRGTSVSDIAADLETALADRAVTSILLAIESPGGSVSGIPELAASIREARKDKPVTAYIDDIGCSGAYYLAAQADMIFASRGAMVGSIGVYSVVVDQSEQMANEGITFNVVRAGEYKGRGLPGTPFDSETQESVQRMVDAYYGLFVDDVAKGRGATRAQIEALADGRVWIGTAAVEAGLVDQIMSFPNALKKAARALVGQRTPAAARANKEPAMANETEHGTDVEAPVAPNTQAQEPDKTSVKDAVTEALADERKRVGAIQAALADYPEIAAAAVQDGLTVEAAKAEAFEAATTKLAETSTKLTEANAKLKTAADAGVVPVVQGADNLSAEGKPHDPAKAAADGTDDGKPETFVAAADALIAKNEKMPVSKAQAEAAKAFPQSYEAWTARNNEQRVD